MSMTGACSHARSSASHFEAIKADKDTEKDTKLFSREIAQWSVIKTSIDLSINSYWRGVCILSISVYRIFTRCCWEEYLMYAKRICRFPVLPFIYRFFIKYEIKLPSIKNNLVNLRIFTKAKEKARNFNIIILTQLY